MEICSETEGHTFGRAIAQVLSCRFATAATRVRARVKSCGIRSGKSGGEATRVKSCRICTILIAILIYIYIYEKNSVALSPRANYTDYTDWATATCRRNLVPTFMDRGVLCGQRGGSPTIINLSFRDRPLRHELSENNNLTQNRITSLKCIPRFLNDRLIFVITSNVSRGWHFRMTITGKRNECWRGNTNLRTRLPQGFW
jgi:hypothetical protein